MYKNAQRHGDLSPVVQKNQGLTGHISPDGFLRVESLGLGGTRKRKPGPSLRKFSWEQEASTPVSANSTGACQ